MEIENIVIKAEPCEFLMEQENYDNVKIKQEFVEAELQNNDKPFKCGICGHRAMNDALLRVHMKVHLVKRLHECSTCKETFFFVTELNRHVLTHTEGRSNYGCKVCGKDCFTQEALNKHFKSHSIEKPFKCKLCDRTFSEDAYLRVHERTHHFEEYEKNHMIRDGTLVDPNVITIKSDLPIDYECPICQKNFLDEEFLKIHLKLHDEDPLCHSIFGSPEDRYEKVVLMHSEIDIEKCRTIISVEEKEKWFFECGFVDENGLKCPRRFGDKETAASHEKSHGNSQIDNGAEAIGENMTRCKEIIKGKEKTVFKCMLCGRFFPVPSKLRSHMRTHTGEKPFKCEICGKAFGTAGSLKDHSYLHTDDRPFKCKLCPKSFTKNCSLEDHIRSHTGEKPYECNICKKKYATIVILNQHLLAHSKEKPFKCDVCDKSFIYLCNLKYHMVSHTGAKPFGCTLCEKAFAIKSALKMHMMDHTGDKPHSCQYCEKKFTTIGGLKKHERVHTGEKPYKCTVCKKGFTQTSSLSRHMDVHTGEKPYKCTVCQKGLTSGSYLKIHMRLHRGEPPYQCKNCPETFTVLKKYRVHIKIHKKKEPPIKKIVKDETKYRNDAKNDNSDRFIKVKEEIEEEDMGE